MFKVPHPQSGAQVLPVELCPILQTLHHILIRRDAGVKAILDTLRDENMYDPVERMSVVPDVCYLSKLLDRHPSFRKVLPGGSKEGAERRGQAQATGE